MLGIYNSFSVHLQLCRFILVFAGLFLFPQASRPVQPPFFQQLLSLNSRLLPCDMQPLPFLSPSFFQDGLKAVESLKPSIETLSTDLHTVSSRLCAALPHFELVAHSGPGL